jgi:proteasome accessory factor C
MTGPVRLTARQATAVGVALSALEALPGGWRDVAERLRGKLDAAVGDVPVKVALDEPPFLDDVRTAVQRHERIRVEYVDLADNATERTIDPLLLFVDRGSAYVVADDRLRQGERVFRVDRMLSVAPTGECFEPRPVAAPAAGKRWKWMVPAADVVVRLPPDCGWVLDRYATAASVTADDGWLIVWLQVVSERWLAALLLRCGPGAEVLSPDSLVDLPSRAAGAALARYR